MKNNFTFDFFAKSIIYQYYSNVHNKTTSEDYYNKDNGDGMSLNDVTIVRNVPPYFDARLKTSFNCFKIHYRDGFLANLKVNLSPRRDMALLYPVPISTWW